MNLSPLILKNHDIARFKLLCVHNIFDKLFIFYIYIFYIYFVLKLKNWRLKVNFEGSEISSPINTKNVIIFASNYCINFIMFLSCFQFIHIKVDRKHKNAHSKDKCPYFFLIKCNMRRFWKIFSILGRTALKLTYLARLQSTTA